MSYHDLGPGPDQKDTVIASMLGEESGYWTVTLNKPLPGIRHTVFVFMNGNEADEFASCIHARYEDAETTTEPAGTPQSVFESWSF